MATMDLYLELVSAYSSYFLSVIALTLTFLFLRPKAQKGNLPPGPRGLPIFGYLPFLGKEAYVTLDTLTKKYGPIYSMYLGPRYVVVLGSMDVVKEAYSNNDIMDRPPHPPNHLMPNSTNMAISSGNVWKEQRRFAIQTLRQFGMGKSLMEELIQEELRRFTKEIDSKEGKPMDMDTILLSSVSNNMVSLLLGYTMDYQDQDRVFLDEVLKFMTLYFRPTRIHAYFPWTRPWMAKFRVWGYDHVEKYMSKLGKFIDSQISRHSETLDKENVRDYIDQYLLTMLQKGGAGAFSMKMLKGNVQSLLGAGSTPSRATVEWALVSMVLYPDIQTKVQQELDSVVGRDRLPTWSDRNDLPYTMAVISEVMRHYTIIPIAMLRCTSKDCKIGGYDVPEGAIIMTNIWGVHHDPACWDDPHTFKPERFLGERGKRNEAYIPFSYGKRNCPGEDMANMVVYLYFTTVLHRYILSRPPKSNVKFQEMLGIAKLVILDNVCMTLRN